MRVLGAIMAGGASTRFGSPKALATVGGRRVVDRVADALRHAVAPGDVIAVINDAELARDVGLPAIRDVRTAAGALAGIHAALLHARDHAADAILAAGCDMPFLSVALLRELLRHAADHDAVLPESASRRGIEPLCACYRTTCIAAIEAALDRGDARMIGFHRDVNVHRLTLAAVSAIGDPAVMFLNLNTQDDLRRAQQYAGDTA